MKTLLLLLLTVTTPLIAKGQVLFDETLVQVVSPIVWDKEIEAHVATIKVEGIEYYAILNIKERKGYYKEALNYNSKKVFKSIAINNSMRWEYCKYKVTRKLQKG